MNFKYRYGLLLLLLVAVLATIFFFNPYGVLKDPDERIGSRHKSLRRLPRRLSPSSPSNFSKRSYIESLGYGFGTAQDLRPFTSLSNNAIESGARVLRANIPSSFGAGSSDGKYSRPPHPYGCRMQNCFDHSICQKNGFRVYVYPTSPSAPTASGKYREILNSIKRSRYYTDNPDEACLFVLSLDTLDRDPLGPEYVHNLGAMLKQLSLWKGGVNHVVFNLYSGTWPDYSERDLGFDLGMAMLAKSSLSQQHFRPDFDISFPLFHKEHSFKAGEGGYLVVTGTLTSHRRYTLVFKGKRYLAGIGSETRNSLHHVDNGQDIILLTTCKHGKDWKNMEDERCEKDNKEYDKWDYKVLLKNSTFCLVPRGRRLGSYRFLEALQAGCIPVILSNDWVLPFPEVIDWKKAVIWADERLLLQLPSIVRSIDMRTILSLRQQTQFLWETYFSSIDKIVSTTLEIIKARLSSSFGGLDARTSLVWNSSPGGLVFLQEYSQSLHRYPFYADSVSLDVIRDDPGAASPILRQLIQNGTRRLSTSLPLSSSPSVWPEFRSNEKTSPMFDAVVRVTNLSLSQHFQQSPLVKILKTLVKCNGLRKVYLLWELDEPQLPSFKWNLHFPIIHKRVEKGDYAYVFEREEDEEDEEVADAILNMDENSLLTVDEVEFGFHVWTNFQQRLVGYNARSHYWHDAKEMWRYTSKATTDFSIVLTTPAFYHVYYNSLYSTLVTPSIKRMTHSCDLCHDIVMNALVSHATKLPPIKVGPRRTFAAGVLHRPAPPNVEFEGDADRNKPEFNAAVANEMDDKEGRELLYRMLQQRVDRRDQIQNEILNATDANDRILKNKFFAAAGEGVVPLRTNAQNNVSFDGAQSDKGFRGEGRRLTCAHACLRAVSDYLGYMPLLKSTLRIDPLLFRDPVSVLRKKYPGMDKIT